MEMLSSECILTLISLSVHLHRAHSAMDHYSIISYLLHTSERQSFLVFCVCFVLFASALPSPPPGF